MLFRSRIDIAMEVGTASESVTVSDTAPLMKTESGELSHNVDTSRLNNLPVLGIGALHDLRDRHDELVAAAAELIAGCGCEGGCPACTGPRLEPEVDARALALRLLGELGAPRPIGAPRTLPLVGTGAAG